MKVDLFLGSDIGKWALENVSPDQVNFIFTLDPEIELRARDLGYSVGQLDAETQPKANFATAGLSVHYPKIFSQATITKYRAMYNLHPSYLPWGRGFYPIFWALWEQCPAGATLHMVTEKVDEGALVDQRSVEYTDEDTGWSLYTKVREAERTIFLEYWPRIVAGEEFPTQQQIVGGTFHLRKEFFALRKQNDWRTFTSNDLVRLARAFTFPGSQGLEILIGNKWMEVCVASGQYNGDDGRSTSSLNKQ